MLKDNFPSVFKYLSVFVAFAVFFLWSIRSDFSYASDNTPTENTHVAFDIYFFGSKYCPHCTKAKEFLAKLEQKYPQVKVNYYEITQDADRDLLIAVGEKYNFEVGAVPLLLIGDHKILGYGNEKTTGAEIEFYIQKGLKDTPVDLVKPLSPESTASAETVEINIQNTNEHSQSGLDIKLPFMGIVNSSTLSLPVFTLAIALLDGFNPCAMWVLLFLISLLLGFEDRKKMWLLGGTFIFTSGLIYFLFLSAWLNFFMWIGFSGIARIIIGMLAIVSGVKFLKEYFKNPSGGCTVVGGNEQRQQVFYKLKKITQNNKIIVAMLGMMGLAVTVNIVELVCSAGLPAIYTQVLSMNSLTQWQYYAYLILYILVFMLDDMFIFVTAMVTLQMTGIQSKYSRYSHLVGGIIILIIGILMLLNPGLLMFS